MIDLTTDVWMRQGCSLVWDTVLLEQLLGQRDPLSLRDVLLWGSNGFPRDAPGRFVLVSGLQSCLEVLQTPEEGSVLLRQFIQPLIFKWQDNWPMCALLFGLQCSTHQWSFDADDNASLKLQHGLEVSVTTSLWGGAAHDAQRISLPLSENTSGTKSNKSLSNTNVFGGFYVRRLS